MKNISYKSIILSNLLYLFVSTMFTIIYSIYMYIIYHDSGLSLVGQFNSINDGLFSTSTVIMLNILSILPVILIGYFAAHISKSRYIFHGALSTILNVLLSIPVLFSDIQISYAEWVTIVIWIPLGPVFGALGGYLYGRYKNR